eukprot:7057992-Lingulodinium_polyedra.AAC.1
MERWPRAASSARAGAGRRGMPILAPPPIGATAPRNPRRRRPAPTLVAAARRGGARRPAT